MIKIGPVIKVAPVTELPAIDQYKIATVYVEDTRSDHERAEQMRREVKGLCIKCGGGPLLRQRQQRYRYTSDRGQLLDGVREVDQCCLCNHAEPVRS